jgi:two-component system sensor histidine kinase UhpB
MYQRLKILHLEDVPDDAELVEWTLKKAGIDFQNQQVDNKQDFINALKNNRPDIILSDHSLPLFDSHEALKIAKGMDRPVPFILVTATVSEEYAVNIIKEGASDYILKDRLQRLPTAIWGAIDKYNLEAERIQSEETLKASERKYKLLFDNNPLPMWMVSISTMVIIDVNEAAVKHYGYSREEFLNMHSTILQPPEEAEKLVNYMQPEYKGIGKPCIRRHIKKDGGIIQVDIIVHDVLFDGNLVRLVSGNDVTERLKAEADLARQRILQQKIITETSIQVQERERKEIGEELHDNINQVLATAKLYLDLAIAKHSLDSEYLANSRNNIMLAIEEIRKLSHTLVAPSLGNITLTEAIKELIHEIRLVTSLQLNLRAEHYDEAILDKDIKLMFYRIVQEQVNNIVKHSGADAATILLYTGIDYILLSLTDNGAGFDNTQKHEGIGLKNIRNRVGFYDGTVSIFSQPGKGCTLEVKIPL